MNIEKYLDLPCHITMVREEHDGEVGWVVSVGEFPGCISEGDTPEEAVEMIRDAMHGWLAVKLEHGDPIPPPRPGSTHSGRSWRGSPRDFMQNWKGSPGRRA